MRYRPFARTGIAVSTLSLALDGVDDKRSPTEWRDFVHGAFEEGVNTFELTRPSPALVTGFAEGVAAVKRSLLFVSLRLDPTLQGERLEDWARAVVAEAGIGEVNMVIGDAGASAAEEVLTVMFRLQEAELTQLLAVSGDGDLLAADIAAGCFDAIVAPFNMLSGWRDRNLVRTALEKHMGVVACEPFPAELDSLIEATEAQTKPGWFRKPKPLAGAGTYAFMHSTPSWSAEQLCLAYALTEPAVATVQVGIEDREHLAALAEVTDRDLPSTVSAQIEMARFSAEAAAQAEKDRRRA
jgi:aryl-alcohol dehydrogenase-like predicted oxidoreductase